LLDKREDERKRLKYIHQQELEKKRQANLEIHNQIIECANSWLESEELRKFAGETSNHLTKANDAKEKENLARILKRVEAQIMWLDPFVEYADELLGEGISIRSVYKLMNK